MEHVHSVGRCTWRNPSLGLAMLDMKPEHTSCGADLAALALATSSRKDKVRRPSLNLSTRLCAPQLPMSVGLASITNASKDQIPN